MKLHLPVLLRKAVLACFSFAFAYSMSAGSSAAVDLTLGDDDSLSIDYADADSIPNLENGTLRLNGDTILHLSNCGEGDGKTYTLLTGVSALLDDEGNVLSLDSSNNAVSLYFDTTKPGVGFWADATLQLSSDGTLQLVRHQEIVKAAKTITTRQTEALVHYYYDGISFEDITHSSSSSAYGGAIYGGSNSTITLSDNGSVEFSGNTASSSYSYGGAIYGKYDSTITLSGNGSVEFSGNVALSGGAVYAGDLGFISLINNGNITFVGNTAGNYGGAVAGRSISSISLIDNVRVTFIENKICNDYNYADALGGAIFGDAVSSIILSDNGGVEFHRNQSSSPKIVDCSGGAIYGGGGSTITLSRNGMIIFSENTASSTLEASGGAIYGGDYSTITLSGNDSVTFSGNTASSSSSSSSSSYSNVSYGGAIYGYSGSTITLSGNGSVTFCGNMVSFSYDSAHGGAIYGDSGSTITLCDNGSVMFIGNTASSSRGGSYGGAIYGGSSSTIILSDNGSVTFSGNEAYLGGAIYGWENSTIELSGNESVTFSENRASYGGAINGDSGSMIELSGNGSVTFSGNSASYNSGGAIYGYSGSMIELSGNGSVTFSGNTASDDGGAIYGGVYSTITLSGNGSVTFIGNTASSDGGAIYGGAYSTITLSGNGSVTFSENTASYDGGAIYGGGGSTITLSGNDSVTFSENTAHSYGGAIRAYGNLSIRNNDSVLFEKNAEIRGEIYRLRSIYAGGSWYVISLSAAEGKSIEFRDSVYIDSGSTVDLNADYTDAAGVVHKQTGDIIFTGAYTEQHLNELLAADGLSRTATEEEILNSRTMEVYAMTNLYGGRLRVEDGAIYKGRGITVAEGSGASVLVKDAVLNHQGYELIFHAGTVLQTEGVSYIDGNVKLYSDSTLNLGDLGNVREISKARINGGQFNVDGIVIYSASVDLNEFCEDGDTIILGSGTYNWNPDDVQASLSITWVDKVLGVSEYLETNEQGKLIFAVRSTDSVTWDNAVGDGLWNNRSANWVDNGYRFAYVQGTSVTFGKSGEGRVMLEGDIVAEHMTISSGAAYELLLQEVSSLKINGTLNLDKDSSLHMGMGIAVSSLRNQGCLSVAGNVSVADEISGGGEIVTAGNLTVDGVMSAGTAKVNGMLSTGSLAAANVQAGFVFLAVEDAANSVSGDLTAESVSLASGASLEVGGTLTAAEVLVHGPAKVLQAGAFGAETMNFVLDRAALESLNLSYDETGTIARADVAMGSGFAATLNGGTSPVQAAAYVYDISVNGGAVQLTADYAHDGLQVWYRSGWVGESGWTDYYIAGYDAVDGVETIDLDGDTVQGDALFIAYEEGVSSSVVTNGVLEFAYVDMGGGQFELGADAEMTTDELYGKGETLVMHKDSVLNATELTLGTLALEGGELTVKKATINAMSGTEGTLNIESRGQVTVKSDMTLTGLENLGTLKLGVNNLTVNALVDVGGNVTAGEVAVQSRGSRMASFDKLVADKVTVVNNISTGRYTDGLSVGDGSAIGELVAEVLEVREGVVTLGRTDAATEQTLLALDLQEDAALVLNQQTALTVTDEMSATEGAELRLKQQASVSYGAMNISNRGAAAQVVVNAYDLANDSIQELSNAHVAVGSSDDTSIDYKLTNSSVENTGSGKLYLTHGENTFSSISAAAGDIAVLNQALELQLDELVIGDNASFSAYQGEVESPELEAVVRVSQSVSFGAGAHINADLKLQSGVKVEMNGPVTMGSDLYLEQGMTLGGTMLETLTSAGQGQTVVLFSGIDRLYLCGEEQTDAIALSHGVSASEYFVNLISSQERSYYLVYDNEVPGEGVLSIAVSGLSVPEPTSSTLSLLALAALAARRRRK